MDPENTDYIERTYRFNQPAPQGLVRPSPQTPIDGALERLADVLNAVNANVQALKDRLDFVMRAKEPGSDIAGPTKEDIDQPQSSLVADLGGKAEFAFEIQRDLSSILQRLDI